MKVSLSRNSHFFRSLTAVNACFLAPYDTVILLQIVMVSPGAHLVKNHSLRGRRKKGRGRGEGEREKGRERLL